MKLRSVWDDLKSKGIKTEKIDPASFREFNKHMEDIRREFIIKSIMSERDAAKIILNN